MAQHPFERFSEDSKKALVLAQQEAKLAHHGFIGTEHLLLGLLRLQSGSAHRVLRSLAIDIGSVREQAQMARGRTLAETKQAIPTSRVKRVVEIAFEESRRMRKEKVHSGHLLVGLAVEGQGVAAHVLKDLGIPAERMVAEVERALEVQPGHAPKKGSRLMPPTTHRDQRLGPPPKVAALRERLASMQLLLRNAAAGGDGEHALKLAGEVNRLGGELDQAERDWFDSLD
jgi:ATP-dependent Clp protease ATP-binding subunit ClpC